MMKVFLFILMFSSINLSANNVYSQKLTLNLRNVSLQSALQTIKAQTGYYLLYSTAQINPDKKISASLKNVSLDEALRHCLNNTGLEYVIKDSTIVISPESTSNAIRSNTSQSQELKIVTGKVTDQNGEPLTGVAIVVKGTNNGVVSDPTGSYRIRLRPEDNILVFSFIGMVKQEIPVNNRKVINVVLEESQAELEQVVVTGYFTANKQTYTGSSSTITANDIIRINSGNILQAVQTLEPSFRIIENTEQGSNPNALPDIELRGSGSLPGVKSEYQYNPNMPTFILDGFEVSAQKIFDLDPNRVLSITILKDAAATAIYGSRAANGIVVVETKIPQKGQIKVNYKTDIKFTSADLSGYDLLNASEKLQYEVYSGVYPGSDRISEIERNMDEYNQKLKLVAMGYDTDWLSQPINPVSVAHKHSLQIEQGTENFRYNLNLFYDKDNGVMKESSRDRLGIGAYFQYRYKRFLFMNNLTYNHVVANNSPYGNFSDYAKANPYLPFRDINGKIVKYFDFVNTPNPLYNSNIGVIDKDAHDEIINNFKLEWNITDGVKIRSLVAFSKKIVNNQYFLPAEHTSQINIDQEKKGQFKSEYGEDRYFNANSVLSLYKQHKDHFITFNGGLEVTTRNDNLNTFLTTGFPNSLLAYPSFATAYGGAKPSGNESIARSLGFFGTLNYSWKNKYYTDFSGRMDGSSKFGANQRWAKLWSVGIGWNVHYEDFLKDSKIITSLRLRASTGFTGSQNYNPNQSLTMFDYIRDYFYQWSYQGAQLMAMGNENLKWQRVSKNNVGMDIDLFNKRFVATFDYYKENSKDALTPVTIPPSLGFTSYTENLGEVSNSGYEIKLSIGIISDRTKDLNWIIFGSASHNKNRLVKISNALTAWNTEQDAINTSTPKVRFIEGQDMKSIWVVPSVGIDPITGNEIFINKSGEYTTSWNAADQIVGGSQTPELFGNIGTQFAYKQWQINLYLLYSYGGETYNQTLVSRVENADPLYNVDRRALENRWKTPGDISRFKNINNTSITKPTSRFIENDNYLRMTSFNLSYEFNKKQINKYYLERLKLILYANDVFNISSVKQERGLSYPFARSFTLTVQLGF
ncbi:MAG: SusC/RagA family TonB-linked outer membrane protein [Bacteroidales bacterium]|nr:SusC/RagA family TonB-linked outer membrane protein [Bacteroidales bacterium]